MTTKQVQHGEIHTIQRQAAQGELIITRIAKLPEDARLMPRNGPAIIGHSETGHHHQIDALDVAHYESGDPLVAYLQVADIAAEGVLLEHAKAGPHVHATFRLMPGTYQVNRQRELSPEGWERAVQD